MTFEVGKISKEELTGEGGGGHFLFNIHLLSGNSSRVLSR